MIIYNHRACGGFKVLTYFTGSALVNRVSLPMALLSGLIAIIASLVNNVHNYLDDRVDNVNAYFGGLSFIVGFVVVYRAQLAIQRYDIAQRSYFTMCSKIADMAMFISVWVTRKEGAIAGPAGLHQSHSSPNIADKAALERKLNPANEVPLTAEEEKKMKDEAKQMKFNEDMTFTLVRWLTLYHELGTEEIQGFEFQPRYPRTFITTEEAFLLSKQRRRPIVVMQWILDAVAKNKRSFVCTDPILTRLYNLASEANNMFNECRRISETPFPFPFAQITMVMITFWAVITPIILVTGFSGKNGLATLIAFFGTWMLFGVNEAASQLEQPFDEAENDLPILNYSLSFQEQMTCLLSLKTPSVQPNPVQEEAESVSETLSNEALTPLLIPPSTTINNISAKQNPSLTAQPVLNEATTKLMPSDRKDLDLEKGLARAPSYAQVVSHHKAEEPMSDLTDVDSSIGSSTAKLDRDFRLVRPKFPKDITKRPEPELWYNPGPAQAHPMQRRPTTSSGGPRRPVLKHSNSSSDYKMERAIDQPSTHHGSSSENTHLQEPRETDISVLDTFQRTFKAKKKPFYEWDEVPQSQYNTVSHDTRKQWLKTVNLGVEATDPKPKERDSDAISEAGGSGAASKLYGLFNIPRMSKDDGDKHKKDRKAKSREDSPDSSSSKKSKTRKTRPQEQPKKEIAVIDLIKPAEAPKSKLSKEHNKAQKATTREPSTSPRVVFEEPPESQLLSQDFKLESEGDINLVFSDSEASSKKSSKIKEKSRYLLSHQVTLSDAEDRLQQRMQMVDAGIQDKIEDLPPLRRLHSNSVIVNTKTPTELRVILGKHRTRASSDLTYLRKHRLGSVLEHNKQLSVSAAQGKYNGNGQGDVLLKTEKSETGKEFPMSTTLSGADAKKMLEAYFLEIRRNRRDIGLRPPPLKERFKAPTRGEGKSALKPGHISSRQYAPLKGLSLFGHHGASLATNTNKPGQLPKLHVDEKSPFSLLRNQGVFDRVR